MEKSTVFKNNQTQAIRLPKAVAFPDDVKKVTVLAVGRSRIITPTDAVWDSWFDSNGASDDFMAERDQPSDQLREAL